MKSNRIEFHDPHSRYETRVARPGKLYLNPEKRGPYRSKPELQYSQKTGLLCSINIIMYGLYGLKHHIVEIRGDVTMRDGRTNEQTTEDRATQPMEAGG